MNTPESWAPGGFNPAYILPGTRVGSYVIRRGIGRGGAQMAYLAQGPGRREVVLKVSLYAKGEEESFERMMHDRFLRQVAYFLELDGVPGVATVYAHDMHPDTSPRGYAYMVQEWVPGGRNIVDWSRGEPHALDIIVLGWVMLAGACGEMARRGICHRDLKADNILMTPRGIPKVIDFNTGRGMGAEPLLYSSAGRVPGTRSSFSPELCEAILEEKVTRRQIPFTFLPTHDLHALGTIFYEVLTGEHPFDERAEPDALYEQIAREVPDRPNSLNPLVPFGLDKIVMKLLQKDPRQRYQSGLRVAKDLEALLSTDEDWNMPFQTPSRRRHSTPRQTSPGPPAPITDVQAPPPTPPPQVAPYFPSAPSAIVLAGPRAIVLRGPVALRRLRAPAPRAKPRRFASLAAAVLAASVLLVTWALVGQHGALHFAPEKGPMVLLSKVKAAVVAAASSALAACTGLTGNVRLQDEDWFAKCPAEARKTVKLLGIDDEGIAFLDDGPNVITHDAGCEVKAGPLQIEPAIPGLTGKGPVLVGEIRLAPDGASLRFTKLKLRDGREFPVCAIATAAGARPYYGPGLETVHPNPAMPPASELHAAQGFIYVTTGKLDVYLAK